MHKCKKHWKLKVCINVIEFFSFWGFETLPKVHKMLLRQFKYCFYYLNIYNITTENEKGLLINMTLPKQIQKHAHMNFQTLFVKSLVPTVKIGISAAAVAAFYSN